MQENWVIQAATAEYEALSGNDDAALAALERAIDAGLRGMVFLNGPQFDGLRERPEFIALSERMLALIDEQRAILGMPPYRPVQPTEKRPTFVN
jgi:hypothetical protein